MARLGGAEQRRVFAVAGLESLRAARMEAAAGREVGGVGQLAAERRPVLARGHGVDERLRVGVAGALDHVARVALLDDPAEAHDRDAVAQLPRQRQVVGDEQQRQLARPLELEQDVQDLERIETSSIETGSSQTMPAGSSTSVEAIATRWRWPPESWCG